MKKYRVMSGERFVFDGGKVAVGGDIIELEDDVAAAHAARVSPILDDSKAAKASPSSAKASTDAGTSS